jgi:hypothetical protein
MHTPRVPRPPRMRLSRENDRSAKSPYRGAERSVLRGVVIRSPTCSFMRGYAQLMWNMPQSQLGYCDIDHSERHLPPTVAEPFGLAHRWRPWARRSQT